MDQGNFHVQLPLGHRTKGWTTGRFVHSEHFFIQNICHSKLDARGSNICKCNLMDQGNFHVHLYTNRRQNKRLDDRSLCAFRIFFIQNICHFQLDAKGSNICKFNLMHQVNFHVQLPLGDRTKGWTTGRFVARK